MKGCESDGLVFVLADVHGRTDLLQELTGGCLRFAAAHGCANPLFVFLGDYIDRGPDSADVVAFLRAFDKHHQIVALRGNHEQMMIDTLLYGDSGLNWASNGLMSTVVSYGLGGLVARHMPADEKLATLIEALRVQPCVINDARWLANLPLVHEDQHRIYVHAGLRPGVPLADQTAADMLWIRERFLRHRGSFGKLVVHGHTARAEGRPDVLTNRVNLDTGAYWTGILTAAVFNNLQAQPITFLRTGDRL